MCSNRRELSLVQLRTSKVGPGVEHRHKEIPIVKTQTLNYTMSSLVQDAASWVWAIGLPGWNLTGLLKLMVNNEAACHSSTFPTTIFSLIFVHSTPRYIFIWCQILALWQLGTLHLRYCVRVPSQPNGPEHRNPECHPPLSRRMGTEWLSNGFL